MTTVAPPRRVRQDFAIRPFEGPLGAEVLGLDLSVPLDGADFARLHRAHLDHHVLVFRDQRITPQQQIDFSRRFGPLQIHVLHQFQLAGHPEVLVVSNIVENGRPIGNPNDGFGWHTDQYYFERPTAYTFLYAIETPPEGADTQFCDTMELYDDLSEAQRQAFGTIRIRASHSKLNEGRLHPGQEEAYPDVVHDLVRKHPISGRRFLYFSGAVTSLPHDMPSDEFAALHRDLHARATQPDRVYSHKWRPKDLVIWDNRGLLHRATPYDKQHHRRLCHRLSVIGERPIK